MAPEIPNELLDRIIDHLHNDFPSLKSWALVSKSWLPRARFHLFHPRDLIRAVEEGSADIIRVILTTRQDSDVNMKDANGRTPLLLSILYRKREITRMLLEREDVDVNSRDRYKQSALTWVTATGNKEIFEWLLVKQEIDLISKDTEGWTPLMYAAAVNSVDIVKGLLRKDDTNLNAKNNSGNSALSLAARQGHKEVVKILSAWEGIEVD